MSDLNKKLKELLSALEKSNSELVQGYPFPIIDLSLPYAHMFSPASKRGMAHRINNLLPKREIKFAKDLEFNVEDKVHYFSVFAVGEDKIVKAARIVTNDINFLSARGYVTACLQPLSCVALTVEPHRLEEYAVFCYVALTKAGSEWLDKEACGSHLKDEGQMPSIRVT